jgi:hypothetical protein
MKSNFQFSKSRTVSSHASKRDLYQYRNVPEIKLQGIYLENAGFVIGEKVNVNVINNQIIISRNQENEAR